MTDRAYYIASASIVAIATASASWATRIGYPPGLSPGATEMALGQLSPAQLVKVPFRIHNGSDRSLRIVGATMTCKRSGCFGPDTQFPMTIPSGGEGVLDSLFKAGDPGIFSHPMTVFTDCEETPKFVLSVTGQIAAPKGTGGL